MFEELFAPGRKHTDDERKRLELTRVDLNDGDPGRGPIDLSSGKVVVRARQTPERDATAEGTSSEAAVPASPADAVPAATEDDGVAGADPAHERPGAG
ncbi:DUF6191 domain-containing protein [Streptomyces sp. NPDC005551]